MPKSAEPTEADEVTERDLSAYTTKQATPSLEFYAEWLKDVVGFDPNSVKNRDDAFARGVYLAVTLHRDFQVSPENANFKEEQKAAREAEFEQIRAEKEADRERKAQERAEAAEAAEIARAEKEAEKEAKAQAKADKGATPATKAAKAAKPAAKPGPAKPAVAGRTATARPARRTPVRAASTTEAPF